ncbi:calmodulin [Blakeslea trispora]|nr:calmodulin [Blakeslea trispora]
MTTSLTKDMLADCEDAFKLFDHNNDGAIDASELGSVMTSLGLDPTKEEVNDMINNFDIDHSGKIEYREFLDIMTQFKDKDELVDAFRVFDKNNDGYITLDELRSVMKHLGQSANDLELDKMIEEADVDGDGRIDYKEFAKIMSSA